MPPSEDVGLVALLEQVLDASLLVQHADFGDIQLYDPESDTLRLVAHRGVPPDFVEHFACVAADDDSACDFALRDGHRFIIADVTTYGPYEPHRKIAAETGYRAVTCTPLLERGTRAPLGMLTTLFREADSPDEQKLRLSDLFAAQAADLISSHLAQHRLSASEEHLRLALEAAEMGTWEWDYESRLITADKTHQALFGMAPQTESLSPDAYWACMARGERESSTREAVSALQAGSDIQLEFPISTSAGKTRWISVRGRPRSNGTDSIIGISRDVTERKERERRLRENREWLAAVLDQVPGGVGLFDNCGHLLLRGGPLGRMWSDVLPSLDPASAHRWRGYHADGSPIEPADYPGQRALRGEIVTPGVDFLHNDESGKTCWFRVSAAPFREGEKIAGAVAFIQDIDKEKRAEERLRQSEEKLSAAVELAGLGLYSIEIVDGESSLSWDHRVRRMWGLPPDAKVTYEVWHDAIHPDDLERVDAAVARAYDSAGEGLYDVQYRVIGADGVERWVATRGEASFVDGRPASLLGVALDITDRKMIEHGLELVIEMRDSELEEVSASLEAEARARERVSERMELLQSELSRGLFAAIENRQTSSRTGRQVAEAARKLAKLSPRERQVLNGLVGGEPHKTIAHGLGISVRTVELHRSRMLHRLGTPHLADAIRVAVLAELASEPPQSANST
jgi:PAS domain S-box-containing protein